MAISQAEKAASVSGAPRRARRLRDPESMERGLARVLAGLGFAALATSSGACAGTLGGAMAG